jgi:hypothetical protein
MTRTKCSIPGGLYAGRTDREDDVMTRKVVSGVLAVIGILALSAGAAQAGSGGQPFALTSFFVCNAINGNDPGRVVDIQPGAGQIGPARQNVNLGNGILACAVAKLFVPGTADEIPPNDGVINNQQLKCYAVTVSPRNSGIPAPIYSIIDQLFPGTPTPTGPAYGGTDTGVRDNGISLICAPAKVTQ